MEPRVCSSEWTLAFLSTNGAYNPHFLVPTQNNASKCSRFGSERVIKKKNPVSSSLFSSLCFQAAMPLGRSLLSCRRLQHQVKREAGAAHFKGNEPTARSRQLHKNTTPPENKKWINVRDLQMRRNHTWQSVFYVVWAFKLRSVDIFLGLWSCSCSLRTLSKTSNLEPTPWGPGASEVTDLPPQQHYPRSVATHIYFKDFFSKTTLFLSFFFSLTYKTDRVQRAQATLNNTFSYFSYLKKVMPKNYFFNFKSLFK